MKYAIESIFNRVEQMEDRIIKRELEDKNFEIIQLENKEKRMKRIEESL